MQAHVRTVATSCLAALVLAVPAAAADPAAVPRYHLKVGQELIYRGDGAFKFQGGQHNGRSTWHVWVVRENPDGSWHLVLRNGSAFSQGDAKDARPEDVTFAYCDLFPDGRIVDNESLGFHLTPQTILPRLPRDAAEAAKGWTAKSDRMDVSYHCRLLDRPADAGHCTLEVVQDSSFKVIYGYEVKDVVTFDTRRGLVEKVESESKQTYGFNGKGTATTKLDDIEEHDPAWCQDFAADARRFFAAQEAYNGALRDQRKTVEQTKAALARGADELRAIRKELKQPEFQKQVDQLLAKHEQNSKYTLEEAEARAALLAMPAAAWETTDLEGKRHALKDYRGKVLVLDFWYRGCGWCMRAMPQVKEVAEHFKGKPVAVFGMTIDRKDEDARFVVEKMGLKYPTLKATAISTTYRTGKFGYPTLLVIDQEGVIRDIHVGYSPTLREEVVKAVEGLLGSKPEHTKKGGP